MIEIDYTNGPERDLFNALTRAERRIVAAGEEIRSLIEQAKAEKKRREALIVEAADYRRALDVLDAAKQASPA